jgi:hypothetical protein
MTNLHKDKKYMNKNNVKTYTIVYTRGSFEPTFITTETDDIDKLLETLYPTWKFVFEGGPKLLKLRKK